MYSHSCRMRLICLIWFALVLSYGAAKKLPISVLMLAWKNPMSLNHTLQSYKSAGFFDVASEFIIFFQEFTEAKIQSVKEYPVTVIGSAENVFIAKAMQMLFSTAQFPFALFVEKDFSIEIRPTLIYPELKKAMDTVANNSAVLYQLRSQVSPGKPYYAKDYYYGKEKWAVDSKSIHLCALSAWIHNATDRWPDYFKTCQPHNVTCVDSAFCNWTNNPFLTSVNFWNEHIQPAILDLYHRQPLLSGKQDKTGSHLVEPFMKKNKHWWAEKHYMVAVGKGVFTHFELDN